MALELRTEYPPDYKAAAGAPVIAQESSDFMRFFPRDGFFIGKKPYGWFGFYLL